MTLAELEKQLSTRHARMTCVYSSGAVTVTLFMEKPWRLLATSSSTTLEVAVKAAFQRLDDLRTKRLRDS